MGNRTRHVLPITYLSYWMRLFTLGPLKLCTPLPSAAPILPLTCCTFKALCSFPTLDMRDNFADVQMYFIRRSLVSLDTFSYGLPLLILWHWSSVSIGLAEMLTQTCQALWRLAYRLASNLCNYRYTFIPDPFYMITLQQIELVHSLKWYPVPTLPYRS